MKSSDITLYLSSWQDQKQLRAIKTIELCKGVISSVIRKANVEDQNDYTNFRAFLHIVIVFQIELLCSRSDWDSVVKVISVSSRSCSR